MSYQIVAVLAFLLVFAWLISSTNTVHGDASNILKVSLNGNGDFNTVQKAVDAVSDHSSSKTLIQIHSGVYREKVVVNKKKTNLILQGEGYLNTIISWNDTVHKKDKGMFDGASMTIFALNFTAYNISFQNTASPPGEIHKERRAVAIAVEGDQAAFYGCGFYSIQDTLLDDSQKHYYKECFIQGAVDFIFGNGLSLFEDCTLNIIGNATSAGISGVITAQARTSLGKRSGFSFVGCRIVGSGKALLGRAYRPYSTVVFINTDMSPVVSSAGWDDCNHTTYRSTVFFGEYGSYGPGANNTHRVSYSKQLSHAEALPFMSISYVQGDKWLPSPNVTYY